MLPVIPSREFRSVESQVPEVRSCRSDSRRANLQGLGTTYELFVRRMWIDLDNFSENRAQTAQAEARLARVIWFSCPPGFNVLGVEKQGSFGLKT